MWSPHYSYYSIRSDAKHSVLQPTHQVVEVLISTGVLVETNVHCFCNKEAFPWVEIVCVKADERGSFRYTGKEAEVNLITIVTSKKESSDAEKYIRVFCQVAKKLKWELVLEQDDEGNEDILIPLESL